MKDDEELTALLRTAARAIGDDVRADGAAMVCGFRRARRRQRLIEAGAVAAVILVAAAVLPPLLTGDGGTVNVAAGDAAGSYRPGWTQLPDSLLSPRTGATAATVGDEIVVAGGRQWFCQPGASCPGMDDPGLADGAIFSVSSRKWRPIAPAPFGFTDARAVVVGDAVFLFVCEPRKGVATSPIPSRQSICDGGAGGLLRYRISKDAWDVLPRPPSDGYYELAATETGPLAYVPQGEPASRPDWQLDPAAGTWRRLPDSPHPGLLERHVVADGRDLLLFGTEMSAPNNVNGGGGVDIRVTPLGARFDSGRGVWRDLGPVPGAGLTSPVWAVDGKVVLNPEARYDDPAARGGIFDAASGQSTAVPPAPPGATSLSGALGATNSVFTAADGWVLDLPSRTWIEIPQADARNAAITSIGRRLFRFGGERYAGTLGGELRGDAWVWTPPSDPASNEPGSTLAPEGDRPPGADDRSSPTVVPEESTMPSTPPTKTPDPPPPTAPAPTPQQPAPPPTATTATAPSGAPQFVSASGDAAAGRITVRFSLPVVAGDSPATSCCPAGYLAAMSLVVYGADRACSVPAGNAHEYLSGMGTDTITTDASSIVAGTNYISIGSGFVNSAADGTPNAPVDCIPVTVKG